MIRGVHRMIIESNDPKGVPGIPVDKRDGSLDRH
jgi:hypothetical protein